MSKRGRNVDQRGEREGKKYNYALNVLNDESKKRSLKEIFPCVFGEATAISTSATSSPALTSSSPSSSAAFSPSGSLREMEAVSQCQFYYAPTKALTCDLHLPVAAVFLAAGSNWLFFH